MWTKFLTKSLTIEGQRSIYSLIMVASRVSASQADSLMRPALSDHLQYQDKSKTYILGTAIRLIKAKFGYSLHLSHSPLPKQACQDLEAWTLVVHLILWIWTEARIKPLAHKEHSWTLCQQERAMKLTMYSWILMQEQVSTTMRQGFLEIVVGQ